MNKGLYRVVVYTILIFCMAVVWFLPFDKDSEPICWVLKVILDIILLGIILMVYTVDTAKDMPDNYGDDYKI